MKKLISAALFACILLSAVPLSACVNKNDEHEVETPAGGDQVSVLADFETWNPSFSLCRILGGFGKVSENTDEKYVKTGKGSAKLQPLGYYNQPATPFVYFPTYSQKYGRDLTDFSKVKRVSAWLYCENETGRVDMGLISSIASVNSAERIQQKTFTLKQGWNELAYEPDLNVMNIAYDITMIQGVSFAFENVGSRDLADAPVYYLDDVVITQAAEPRELTDVVELNPYEICDFERLYQNYVVTPDADNPPQYSPDLSRVGAQEDTNGAEILPTSGSKMLKAITHPGEKYQATWSRFTIPEKIMQKAFASLTEEEKASAKIQFDIYNAGDIPMIFYPEFYTAGGKDWQAFNVVAAEHRWVTFSLPLSKLNARTVESPGFLKIAWGEYVGGDQTFYFDNFRIALK